MEVGNAKSDLVSLRKLYGLLRRSADDLHTARNGFLDERALLLLKSLLDAALEKLLQTHSKGFAAPKSGVSNLGFSPKSLQSMAVLNLHPPNSSNASNVSLHFAANSDKHFNCHALSGSRDKDYFPDKQMPAEVLSLLSISSNKAGRKRKGCNESQTTKQKSAQILSKNTNPESEALSGLALIRNKKSTCSSSSRMASGFVAEQIPSDAESNGLLKQVANAIDRIELQISALSDRALSGSVVQIEQGWVKQSPLTHFAESVADKSNVVSRRASYMNESSSQYVHGLRLPPCTIDLPNGRPPLPNRTAGNDTRGVIVKPRRGSTRLLGPTGVGQNQRIPRQIVRPVGPQRKVLPHHNQESSEEETATTTSSTPQSSSTWTSQQTSTGSCGSNSMGSESRTSADPSDPGTSGSSEKEEGRSISGESRRSRTDVSLTPAYRSSSGQIGRFRRLKNKLGLIFHHHHHHHHHHHQRHENDGGEGPRKSKGKYLHKMFDQRDREKEKREAAIDKSRKSTVNSAQRKHQVGHFHALVQGLMRHAKHSKKSKQAIHGRKKSQWGKMLKRRRGVKLPNKGRVKIGFTSKKPQLPGGAS